MLKSLLQSKYIFIIIPISILLIIALIWGFVWVKYNYLDGVKSDITQKFTTINYNAPYELTIIKSDKNRIEISNNENYYYDKIDFEVVNKELKITNRPKMSVAKIGAPSMIIYTKDLDKVINNDKGNIEIDNIQAVDIEINVKDQGNVIVENLEANDKFVAKVNDSGDITVKSGKAGTIEASIVNSSGKINLQGLESPTAKIKDIGTGTVKLHPDTVDEAKSKAKSK